MKLTLIITDQTIKIFQPFSNLKIKNQASVKHFFFQKEKERQRKEKEKARKLSRQKIVFSNQCKTFLFSKRKRKTEKREGKG